MSGPEAAQDNEANKALDDGDWEFVPRRRKKGTKKRQPVVLVEALLPGEIKEEDTQGNSKPNPSPELSVADITSDHERVVAKWRASPTNEHLRKLVRENITTHAADIDKAVCLGLGTFDPATGSWSHKWAAHCQLDAFVAMVDCLAEAGNRAEPIKCYFQDPAFTEADKAFITGLSPGYSIVETPAGFGLVDAMTLVFGVHLYKATYSHALRNALPAMMVCTPYSLWEEYVYGRIRLHPCRSMLRLQHGRLTPISRSHALLVGSNLVLLDRVKAMHHTFDRFPFHKDADNAFSGTCVYWRRNEPGDTNSRDGGNIATVLGTAAT